MIRVGKPKSKYPSFVPIECGSKSSTYGDLSSFSLRTEEGYFLENWWQFSKVFYVIHPKRVKYSEWNKEIIWSYKKVRHLDGNEEVTPEYWDWRKKGMENEYPVKFPYGYDDFPVAMIIDGELMHEIEGRKKYLEMYSSIVRDQDRYWMLFEKLKKGKNLLINEYEGPNKESLPRYIRKYGVGEDFIKDNSVEINEESAAIFLNDLRHPFGYGYCLALTLLDDVNGTKIVEKLVNSL